MRYKYWKEEEIKKLIDFYSAGMRIKKISKIMNRSENSIQKGIKRFIINSEKANKIGRIIRRNSFSIFENTLLKKIKENKNNKIEMKKINMNFFKKNENIYKKFYNENNNKNNSQNFLKTFEKSKINSNFEENNFLKKIDCSRKNEFKLINKINVTTKEIKIFLENEGYVIKEKKIDSLPKNCNEKFFFFNNVMLSETRIILIANGIRIEKKEPIFYI